MVESVIAAKMPKRDKDDISEKGEFSSHQIVSSTWANATV